MSSIIDNIKKNGYNKPITTTSTTTTKKMDHMLNPFVHKLELNDPILKLKTAVFSIILLPLRILCICILLLIAWIFACIGQFGLSMQDLRAYPMVGWRRDCRKVAAICMRGLFWAGSFLRVKFIGRHATTKEAPILVVAPHSSFCDSITVIMLGAPAVVAKAETGCLPIFGKLINFTQPIYVWRDDPNSRQNTIKSIIERANSKDDWPQIIIFPEGTCTNRSCLITYKPGAFYPGVPVQPVCIRYPNALDTVTWTWEGPGAFKLLWLTLTQLYSNCEIEFLPVYYPNDAEKKDAKLFAKNVRNVMAKALEVPVSDYTFDDCKIMILAQKRNIPYSADIVDIEKLRQKLGLNATNIEEKIVTSLLVTETNCNIGVSEFSLRLQVPVEQIELQQLFRVFEKDKSGSIDFREYLLCGLFIITMKRPLIDFLNLVSMLYCHNSQQPKRITIDSLNLISRYTLTISSDECKLIFDNIDKSNTGYITYDELEIHLSTQPKYSHIFDCVK